MTRSLIRFVPVTPPSPAGYNESVITDADLVRAALDGKPDAFGALLDRHAHSCLRYATRMLGNREDAEDATQEAFVRAFAALRRYDGRVAFSTWLMTILINRCRTAISSLRRRDGRFVSTPDVDASPDPTSNADDLVLRDAIERALARLEPGQREAFLLKHVQELSYEEMTLMTGIGTSALKMRVQRACERLQQLLEDDR